MANFQLIFVHWILLQAFYILHTDGQVEQSKSNGVPRIDASYYSPTDTGAPESFDTRGRQHRLLFVAGKLFPALSKLFINREKANSLIASLKHSFHLGDFIPLLIAGWGLIPVSQFVFKMVMEKAKDEQSLNGEAPKIVKSQFEKTRAYMIVRHLSELAKIGIIAYAFDMVIVSAHELGFNFPDRISQSVSMVIYILWMAVRLKDVKKHMVYQSFGSGPGADPGKAALVDHLLNFLVYSIAIIVILDLLALNMGVALSSFFAIGSAGTLIFSIATKDVAKEFISGLALTLADKFHPGEEIILEDGTGGVIEKISWMHTHFRSYNDLTMGIPNSKFLGQSIKNLSRCKMCQVLQTIRLKYSDILKIDTVLSSIKEEVKKACPSVITEGRPFRAHLRDFQDDHITVVCDFHFHLPPSGEVYWDNRQKVLKAIDVAMRKSGVNFYHMPTYTNTVLNKRNY
jgi:small-conductance mechanosensitive channel